MQYTSILSKDLVRCFVACGRIVNLKETSLLTVDFWEILLLLAVFCTVVQYRRCLVQYQCLLAAKYFWNRNKLRNPKLRIHHSQCIRVQCKYSVTFYTMYRHTLDLFFHNAFLNIKSVIFSHTSQLWNQFLLFSKTFMEDLQISMAVEFSKMLPLIFIP